MNNNFLYKFNLQLSEKIRKLKVSEFPSVLKKEVFIVRGCFPVWLKDGVKFRYKGRCQICGTDLARTFNRDSTENYDHIIPLELNGSNDPINIQLTCESCSKSKGARNTKFVN
ncbi:HNH endonuclease [Bacillus cereus]|uniref:HNH endonuclease n=1 Tax=Bacillus cereus TaxID=1396 RepID=UPI003C2ECEE0